MLLVSLVLLLSRRVKHRAKRGSGSTISTSSKSFNIRHSAFDTSLALPIRLSSESAVQCPSNPFHRSILTRYIYHPYHSSYSSLLSSSYLTLLSLSLFPFFLLFFLLFLLSYPYPTLTPILPPVLTPILPLPSIRLSFLSLLVSLPVLLPIPTSILPLPSSLPALHIPFLFPSSI